MSDGEEMVNKLKESWHSPIVLRRDVHKASGGSVTRGYMENLDSQQKGPEKMLINNKIGYLSEHFFNWLAERIR